VLDGLGALSLGAGGVPEAPRAPSGDFEDGHCPPFVALPAAALAAVRPAELASAWALRDGRFAQLSRILAWLAPVSLQRLPELRRLGPFGAPRDVLVGTAQAFAALLSILDAAGLALDAAVAPLDPEAPLPPSALLRSWLGLAAAR
jgi:hypothetical protein